MNPLPPFLSFILELISNLITSFQANLALLILQADYSRRRQNWHYQVTFANGIKRQTHTRRTLITTVWRSHGVKWVIVLNMTLSYHSEHVCVKHAQSGKLSFSNRFIVYVCTGENDAKTLRVDANCFENEKKSCVFKRIRIRVDRALPFFTSCWLAHSKLSRNVLLFSCNPIGQFCLSGPGYTSHTIRVHGRNIL